VEEKEHVSTGFIYLWRFYSPHSVGRFEKPAEPHAPNSSKESGGNAARGLVGLSHARLKTAIRKIAFVARQAIERQPQSRMVLCATQEHKNATADPSSLRSVGMTTVRVLVS
jgi:hypothetical protein